MKAVNLFQSTNGFFTTSDYPRSAILLSIFLHLIIIGGLILLNQKFRSLKAANPEEYRVVHYLELTDFAEKAVAPVVDHKSEDLQVAGIPDLIKPLGYGSTSEADRSGSTSKDVSIMTDSVPKKIVETKPRKIIRQEVSISRNIKQVDESVDQNRQKQNAPALTETSDNTNVSQSGSANQDVSGNALESSAPGISVELKASYEQVILSKLQKVKRYPSRALTRGLEGDVVLKLEIDGKGEVIESGIKISSGFSFFDDEVLDMVKRASPFPGTDSAAKFSYIVPIAFRLEN